MVNLSVQRSGGGAALSPGHHSLLEALRCWREEGSEGGEAEGNGGGTGWWLGGCSRFVVSCGKSVEW